MNIVNEQIKHIMFGEGEVIKQEEDKIYVQFSEQYGIKKFIYPDAFEKYLKLYNAVLEIDILEDLRNKKLQAIAENARKQQQYEEEVKNKIIEKLNIAKQKKKTVKNVKNNKKK